MGRRKGAAALVPSTGSPGTNQIHFLSTCNTWLEWDTQGLGVLPSEQVRTMGRRHVERGLLRYFDSKEIIFK